MDNHRSRLRSVLACIIALPLFAQDPIRGPMLGWVFDVRQESIRPILGIAGSSVLGKAADLGYAVKFAAVSGNQEYALALTGDNRDATVVDLRPLAPTGKPVDGVAPGAERGWLSPRGTAAVLWYPEGTKLAVVSGLPGTASLSGEFDLSVEGAPALLAVSDDGSLVLASYPDSKTVVVFEAGGNRTKLPKESAITSLAFLEGSRDALIGGDDGVFVARDLPGGANLTSVSSVSSAGAVAAIDVRRVLLVDGGSQSVVEVNLETGDSRSAQCPCEPTRLVRMSSGGIFRLNEVSSGPLWLLEISENGLRTIFVPPDPSAPEPEPTPEPEPELKD